MATNTLKSMPVTPIAATWTTLYTVPAATKFAVGMVHICSVTGANVNVRVCIVPSAGSPSNANAVLWDFTIAAADAIRVLQGDVWEAGDSIRAECSAASAVTMKVSGIERS